MEKGIITKDVLLMDTKTNILGYSERGIVNALLFSISKDETLIKEFIELISFPEAFEIGSPREYEIIIEQSFSQFGNSDFIIILKYNDSQKDTVLFFEAKVLAQKNNWTLESQYNNFRKDNTSNLFYQLDLKQLLFDNKESLNTNIIIKDGFKKVRKIGTNKVVLKAVEKIIKCTKAFYIAIVPTLESEITIFKANHQDLNISYLPWHNIKKFAKDKKLENVITVFEFNDNQIFLEDD